MKNFLNKYLDKIICIGLMMIFFIAVIINLGSTDSPVSLWSGTDGEMVSIQFVKKEKISKILFFNGIGEGEIQIKLKDGSIMANYKQDYSNVLKWVAINLPLNTEHLYVTVTGNIVIKEIGFLNGENEVIKIKSIKNETNHVSIPELYDEQNILEKVPSYHNSAYFDEVYYARSAEEFLNGDQIFETTHPPMAKNIIFLGVKIFGHHPFGWRITGVIFATAMVGVIYAFSKVLFKKTKYAVIAALILALDFLHFSMSRICTIDTYVAFLILLSYFCTYQYLTLAFKPEKTNNRKKRTYLILTGVFIGLTIASKWNGAFGLVGVAIIYLYILIKKQIKNRNIKVLCKEIGMYIVFLLFIPITIYLLSYLPSFIAKGESYSLKDVLQQQVGMYEYHSLQRDSHPYQSSWWQWFYDYKPLFAASDTLDVAKYDVIYFFINPVLSLGNIVSIIMFIAYIIIMKVKKKGLENKQQCIVIILGLLTTILPWLFVKRSTYIYHFYPTLLFFILFITYMIQVIEKNKKFRYIGTIFLVFMGIAFVLFFPVISGMPFGEKYADFMKPLEKWFWLP